MSGGLTARSGLSGLPQGDGTGHELIRNPICEAAAGIPLLRHSLPAHAKSRQRMTKTLRERERTPDRRPQLVAVPEV